MKNKIKLFVGLSIVALMFAFLPLVYADECVGQSCDANINLTIGNVAPTITAYVPLVDPIVLNGGTTKDVYVVFNATDGNGYQDLDLATATTTIQYSGGMENFVAISCSATQNWTDTSEITCLIQMDHVAMAGIWFPSYTIKDKLAEGPENIYDENFNTTVSELDYISSDVTYFNWLSATLGVDDQEASNTITLSNGGNQDYTVMNITGQKAVGVVFADEIAANKFSVDSETGQTTDQIYMVDNTGVDVSSIFPDVLSHFTGVSSIYAYVDVPNGIRADNYLSSSPWAITLA